MKFARGLLEAVRYARVKVTRVDVNLQDLPRDLDGIRARLVLLKSL